MCAESAYHKRGRNSKPFWRSYISWIWATHICTHPGEILIFSYLSPHRLSESLQPLPPESNADACLEHQRQHFLWVTHFNTILQGLPLLTGVWFVEMLDMGPVFLLACRQVYWIWIWCRRMKSNGSMTTTLKFGTRYELIVACIHCFHLVQLVCFLRAFAFKDIL